MAGPVGNTNNVQNVNQQVNQNRSPIRQINNPKVQGRPQAGGQANIAMPSEKQLNEALSSGVDAATNIMVTSKSNKGMAKQLIQLGFSYGNDHDKLEMARNLGGLEKTLKNNPLAETKLHNMLYVKGGISGIKTGKFTFLRRGLYSHVIRSLNAMHARNKVRIAVVMTYAKTRSFDKAQNVGDAMVHALMADGRDPRKNAALDEQLLKGAKANTQFNKIFRTVMTAHVEDVSALSAGSPKQIAEHDLSKPFVSNPPPQQGGHINVSQAPNKPIPQVLDPEQQQILNDRHMAMAVSANAIDIDRVTKGQLPPSALGTPGKGNQVSKSEQEQQQIKNDRLIAENIADNHLVQNKITKGDMNIGDLHTPGKKIENAPEVRKALEGDETIPYNEMQEAKKLQENFDQIEGDAKFAKYVSEWKDIKDQIEGDQRLGERIFQNDVNEAQDNYIVDKIHAENLDNELSDEYKKTNMGDNVGEWDVDDDDSSSNATSVKESSVDDSVNSNDEGILAEPEHTKGQVHSDLKFAQWVAVNEQIEQNKLTPKGPEISDVPDYSDDDDGKMSKVDVSLETKGGPSDEPVVYEPPKNNKAE